MVRAVIDRFEGDIAVVLIGDESIRCDLPRRYLPPGAGEGHHLTLEFVIDEQGTEQQRKKIQGMMDELLKRD